MRIVYHPSVRQDVAEAMQRYRAVSEKLAGEFKEELRVTVNRTTELRERTSGGQAGWE